MRWYVFSASSRASRCSSLPENAAVRKVATGDAVVDLSAVRPKRARIQQARAEIRLATALLTHLAQRGRSLASCTQADVDAWYAGGYVARRLTHAFVRWAIRSKHAPILVLQHRSTSNPAPIAQHQRLILLRQTLGREDIPLQDRVAAALVVLYAQPITRITRLTTNDVLQDDDEVVIRLGDPPSPVPNPSPGCC
ncbi:hypothetical protein [Streptomyces sp. NBC_01481]|uniref:hypothetical protein n=1 Tax=Streptomyces sp. NBC_01481 TaxID=2975869 RepID=UPI00224E5CA8|nr:hypothetical protein [Streptomyces sp. NBC_01481]MCX4583181.1 hypothetical protein [Streptomyces sp. NBC_01481]